MEEFVVVDRCEGLGVRVGVGLSGGRGEDELWYSFASASQCFLWAFQSVFWQALVQYMTEWQRTQVMSGFSAAFVKQAAHLMRS